MVAANARLKTLWSGLALTLVAALAWGGVTVPAAASAATIGSISGTVMTDTGAPYDGYDPSIGRTDRVKLLQRVTDDDGIWEWQDVAGAAAYLDANGRYSFPGLSAGDYTVLFASESNTYAFQYAGGAASLSDPKLQVIHVDGDAKMANAQLALGSRISGSVVSVDLADNFWARGNIYTPWPDSTGAITWKLLKNVNLVSSPTTSTYDIGGFAPGGYKIVFTANGGSNGVTTVYQPQWYKNKSTMDTADVITVSGTASTNLDQVRMSTAASVKGRVTIKGLGFPVPKGTSVRMYQRTTTPSGSSWKLFKDISVGENGEYLLRETYVPAGKYTFAFGMSGTSPEYVGAYYGGAGKNVYSLDEAVGIDIGEGQSVTVNASLDQPSSVVGNVTVAGTGAALSGVKVALYSYKKRNGDITPSWEKEANATSSGTGLYMFTRLTPAEYRVGFEPDQATGYRAQFYNGTATGAEAFSGAKTVDLTTAPTHATADAALRKGGSISGQVSNTWGTGTVAGVPVYLLETDGSPVAETTTDASGAYTFAAVKDGDYKIKYNREGINPFISSYFTSGSGGVTGADTLEDATPITVSAASAQIGIDTRLKAGLTISGSSGTGNISVQLYTRSGDSWVPFGDPVLTKANGAFTSNGLRKGTYRVGFHDASTPAQFADIYYADSATLAGATDVVVDTASVGGISNLLPAGGTISGTAAPVAGVSLSGVKAVLYRPAGTGPSTTYSVVSTVPVDPASGVYSFSGIVAGTYRIGFTDSAREYAPSFYSETVGTGAGTLPAASDVIVEKGKERSGASVTLQTGAILGGTISYNSTSSKFVVDVFRRGGELGMNSDWAIVRSLTLVPADGSVATAYTMNGFASGDYKIRFTDTNGRMGTRFFGGGSTLDDGLSKVVTLVAGGVKNYRKANITLKQTAKISGAVTGANGAGLQGMVVNAYRKVDSGWSLSSVQATTSSSGAYTLYGLGEGVFRLKFSDPSQALSTEYYHNTATLIEADDLILADGEARTGVDATLESLPPTAKTPTVSKLQISPVTAVQGATVTATATVSSESSSTPTGEVSLIVGGKVVGTGTLNASGVASLTLPADFEPGRYTFTAAYGGDDQHRSSTSPGVILPVVPTASDTHTSLTLSTSRLNVYESAHAAVWVDTASGNATGTVELRTTSPMSTLLATGTLGGGVVVIPIPGLVAGDYKLKAVYKPTGSFKASSSEERTLEVTGKAASSTALEMLDPEIAVGKTARAKVTVSNAPGLSAEGTVSVRTADGVVLGTGVIASGETSTVVNLNGLAAGDYAVSATFDGNGVLMPSSSSPKKLSVVVASYPVNVDVTLAAVSFGDEISAPVTITRKDGAVHEGISGAVQFFDERRNVLIGTATPVTNGAATLKLDSRALGAPGDYPLSVRYSGSGSMSAGTSDLRTLTVTPGVLTAPTPDISGIVTIGSTVSVAPGTWTSGAKLSYQWRLNGTPIPGATGTSYAIPAADAGRKLSVAVTGELDHYTTATRVSAEQTVTVGVLDGPTPTITGTTAVGSTVSVSTGTWPAGTKLSYQWSRNGTPITGATAASYAIVAADAGGKLSVAVTGELDTYTPATKVSAEQTVALGTTDGPTPTITGAVAVGSTVTASTGTWPSGTTFSYRWRLNGTGISGATDASYAIPSSAAGDKLSVAVTAAVPGYEPVTKVSTEQTVTLGVTEGPTPTISGKVAVDSTVSVSTGTWPAGAKLSYQWRLDGAPITGATSASYPISAADAGGKLSVAVTGVVDGYSPTTKTSAEHTVAPGTTNGPTPTISGKVAVGSTVSVSTGTWPSGTKLSYQWRLDGAPIAGATSASYAIPAANASGKLSIAVTGSVPGYEPATEVSEELTVALGTLDAPTPEITGDAFVGKTVSVKTGTWPAGARLSYQWRLGGAPIPGATGSSYPIVSADLGRKLTVAVTGAVDGYDPATKVSDEQMVTLGTIEGSTPEINGTVAVGSTVSVKTGTWPAGTKFSYRWRIGGEPIAEATESTFTIPASSAGAKLSVAVTGTVDDYAPKTTVSDEQTVAPGTMEAPKPEITGTVAVGSTVTVKTGTWPAGARLSYQWRLNGTAIARATGASYKPVAADLDGKLSVAVTGALDGYESATRVSDDRSVTRGGKLVASAVPAVSGVAKPGSVLTVSAGKWTPAAESLKYQWRRDGIAIPGAVAAKYTVAKADVGKKLSVSVTAEAAGYEPGAAASKALVIGLLNTVAPKVSGTAKVGKKLKASKGTWLGGPTVYTYQWYRGGTKIAGATKSSYKLKAKDAKKKLRVRVTVKRAGFPDVTVYSKYSKKVKR